MKILVLDTIHGGDTIAVHLRATGHDVDTVDVYRGNAGIPATVAASRTYDLIIAPVHLDPGYFLLRAPETPVITHHDAVRRILGTDPPSPMIEITGMQGKTTTACALATLMPGKGIVHTSRGTWEMPEQTLLGKHSITPASVIDAAIRAREIGGWLVAEESLGVSGAGEVGVLTSGGDYSIAAGKRSARVEKIRSLARCRTVVAGPGVPRGMENAVYAEDVVSWSGTTASYAWNGISGRFENPVCAVPGYRAALATAAAVACVLGIDPAPLTTFTALPGRMATSWDGGVLVIDNANSGTNADGAIEAAHLARKISGKEAVTLVIGAEAQTICEGFPPDQIERAIRTIRPARVVLVGDPATLPDIPGAVQAADLATGRPLAQSGTGEGSIVLAVKTWR
ncbi:MAG: coenzyme F430 synthase [Methanomicrobiaceae archaeon]|nr:coenzyme F430 synthase [Methanomicrobiaceae archaeon]